MLSSRKGPEGDGPDGRSLIRGCVAQWKGRVRASPRPRMACKCVMERHQSSPWGPAPAAGEGRVPIPGPGHPQPGGGSAQRVLQGVGQWGDRWRVSECPPTPCGELGPGESLPAAACCLMTPSSCVPDTGAHRRTRLLPSAPAPGRPLG